MVCDTRGQGGGAAARFLVRVCALVVAGVVVLAGAGCASDTSAGMADGGGVSKGDGEMSEKELSSMVEEAKRLSSMRCRWWRRNRKP